MPSQKREQELLDRMWGRVRPLLPPKPVPTHGFLPHPPRSTLGPWVLFWPLGGWGWAGAGREGSRPHDLGGMVQELVRERRRPKGKAVGGEVEDLLLLSRHVSVMANPFRETSLPSFIVM